MKPPTICYQQTVQSDKRQKAIIFVRKRHWKITRAYLQTEFNLSIIT